MPDADILVSNDVSRAVTVRIADCAPVLIGDPSLGVVAAVHAGWRGTGQRAAMAGVARLRQAFGSRPEHLVAAIGPCIGPDAYEVGDNVRDEFEAAGFAAAELDRWFIRHGGARPHLDMWQANVDQLHAAGVPGTRIHCLRGCTRTHPDWFFSHRGEGERSGRMVAAIRAGRSDVDRERLTIAPRISRAAARAPPGGRETSRPAWRHAMAASRFR